MTENKPFYRTRVRSRGQITLPRQIREQLNIAEGDDMYFYTNEAGQLVMQPAPDIDPKQARLWTERWQKMQREADPEISGESFKEYDNVEDLIADIEKRASAKDNSE